MGCRLFQDKNTRRNEGLYNCKVLFRGHRQHLWYCHHSKKKKKSACRLWRWKPTFFRIFLYCDLLICFLSRLETTIKSQEAEINDLRGSGGISSTHDSALDSSSHTRESPPSQGLVRSPSSGRGTTYTLRETGTDPVFAWTERPETLSRATSPITLGTLSRATSPFHPYTSSRATSPLKSPSSSSPSTPSKDHLEKGSSGSMSESHDTRDVAETEPEETVSKLMQFFVVTFCPFLLSLLLIVSSINYKIIDNVLLPSAHIVAVTVSVLLIVIIVIHTFTGFDVVTFSANNVLV